MYKVQGISNETFTIGRTEDVLPATELALIKSGKDPVCYWMKRVTEGTRKKDYSIPCWRFVKSQRFISMI